MFAAYCKYALSLGLKAEIIDSTISSVSGQFRGKDAGKAFEHEAGKHVVQRVPPTERNGRRQTSVLSVGVLPLPPEGKLKPIPENELEVTTMIGTGPGGQHRQKTESCARMKHKPTGLVAIVDKRSQHQSRTDALRILTARVNEQLNSETQADYNAAKKEQVSDKGRGNKVRTYNFIRNEVIDHRLNKTSKKLKQFMKGDFDVLFKQ